MARSDRDEQLMRALHDQYAASLWSFVVRLTGGDRSRSQDVVQETMLRAWRNPSVLDEEQGSARAWLFTVARRIVVDEWRSARSRREVTVEEPPELVEADQVDAMLDEWIVAEALGSRVSLDCRWVGATTGALAGVQKVYRLVAVPRDGGPVQTLAQWAVLPGQDAKVVGSTNLSASGIATIELRPVADDSVLLRAAPRA